MSSEYDKNRLKRLLRKESWKRVPRNKIPHARSAKKGYTFESPPSNDDRNLQWGKKKEKKK